MPVEDQEVHPSTKVGADFRWGCWNLPRDRNPIMVKDGHFEHKILHTVQVWRPIEDFGSIECRNDFSLIDWFCVGCQWVGSGEEYARKVQMRAELQSAVRSS